jgi:hypothetical protein
MCCSTGVCGPQVDPVLPRFTEDVHWLANQGVAVERYNLAQQPQAFAGNVVVKEALALDGTGCLPLILIDGRIVSKGRYPEREELGRLLRLPIEVKAHDLPILSEPCDKPGSGCCS